MIQIPGAYAIVDTSIAGGRTIEQHSDLNVAKEALKRLQGSAEPARWPPVDRRPAASPRHARRAPSRPRSLFTRPASPAALTHTRLSALLDNTVRQVRSQLAGLSLDELAQLRDLELSTTARAAILDEIDRFLSRAE